MRVFGVLILFMIGLGFGIASIPANAEPCPFHTHAVAIDDGPSHAAAALPLTGTGDEPVLIGAFEYPGSIAPYSTPDHAVPEGDLCCHVAAAAASAVGPSVGPYHGSVSRVSLSLALPPWAAPLSDIYRPPALS